MSDLLSVGSIAGTIEMDDRLTSGLNLAMASVKKFASDFVDQFGPVSITLGLVTTGIAAISATIVHMADTGSEINAVETGFDKLSGSVGNANAILEQMRQGVAGTVDDLTLMKDANKLLSAGVDANATDFGTLTNAARVLANEGIAPLDAAMSAIDRAMLTGNATRLKRIGITVDTKTAEIAYATSLDTVVASLTPAQKLEADRGAILAATAKIVSDAGVQELTFAQRVSAVGVAVENWVGTLDQMISKSPAVTGAFAAIQTAIQNAFHGNSQVIMDWIVLWVNRFATAVETYGPPIIAAFGSIKDWIVAIYDETIRTWDALPDWFKKIAEGSVVVGAAITVAGASFGGLNTGMEKTIGIAANVAQITGGNLTKGWIAVGEGITAVGAKFGYLSHIFESFGAGALGVSLVNLVTPIAYVGAAVEVTRAAWIAWDVITDKAKRQQDDAAQSMRDMTTANKMLQASSEWSGQAITSEADAVKFLNSHVQDWKTGIVYTREEYDKLAPSLKAASAAVKEKADADAAATVALQKYDESVHAVEGSLEKAIKNNNLTTDSFRATRLVVSETTEGFAHFIPLMDKMIASGQKLTQDERDYYEVAVTTRINTESQAVALLNLQGVTLKMIEADKAHGLTVANLAEKYNTTTTAITADTTALTASRDRLREIAALEAEVSGGTVAETAIKKNAQDFQDKVDKLDKFSLTYNVDMDQLAQIRDLQNKKETLDMTTLQSGKLNNLDILAEKERNTYEAMDANASQYTRAAIEAQRDKMRAAQDAARGVGTAIQGAMTAGSAAVGGLVGSLGAAAAATQTLDESMTAFWDKVHAENNAPVTLDRYSEDQFISAGARFGMTSSAIAGMLKGNIGDSGSLEAIMAIGDKAEIAARNLKMLMAPGATPNPAAILAAQQAIAKWVAMGGTAPTGFAEGGTVAIKVGEYGPETLRVPLGSQVRPGVDTGGGIVNHYWYVNGSAQETANKIKQIFMRDLATQKKLGLGVG